MAKNTPQPPWTQVQQLADQLKELLDQMESDASVAESELTEIPRSCLAHFKKLAKRGLAGGEVRESKKPSRSPWSGVVESAAQLKEHLDIIAEDTAVETELWHNARVLTNRLLRMARKELARSEDPQA